MGLHSGGGPPGLASILRDSPRDHSTLTSLDLIKLSSNLQRAVEYVVGGAAVAAASASPVVSGGHIDYAAVEQHIQQGMLAAVRAATCDPESEPEAAEAARLPPPGAAEQPPAGGAAQPITCSNAMEEAGGSGPVAVAPHEGQQPEALGAPGQTGDVGGATSPPPSRQPAAAASEGRLGPPHASLVEARGECDIDGLCVLSRWAPASALEPRAMPHPAPLPCHRTPPARCAHMAAAPCPAPCPRLSPTRATST
jgi:hypothetical protein